jgi:hypothetical protein
VQLVIVTFSVALPYLRPSSSLPDFMVMQSSPTLIWQFEIWTLVQDEGLIPSVFGECGLKIEIPVTVTLSQNSGFIVQKGEF